METVVHFRGTTVHSRGSGTGAQRRAARHILRASGGRGRVALAALDLSLAAWRAASWERPCSAAQRCGHGTQG